MKSAKMELPPIVSSPVPFKQRSEDVHPDSDQLYRMVEQRSVMGRAGEPDELSPAVVFLASEEASYITGQVLHINGRMYPVTRSWKKIDL
jgi:NAD(P)-dependent dehydrogenase (short-subunit alcohol dehydrogenase family)